MKEDMSLYHVAELAKALSMPILVYDLEASGFRGQKNFGITEVWCYVVTTKGNAVSFGTLIDPECSIPLEVQTLTGITDEMVRGQPKWCDKFAAFFKEAAEGKYLVGGYNNRTFDNHAVKDMNARYGVPFENFVATFDVRNLHLTLSASKGSKGTLSDVARMYGLIPRSKLHRAEADTMLTVDLLGQLVSVYGLPAVTRLMQPNGQRPEKRLSAIAVAKYAKNKSRLTVDQVAKFFATPPKETSFEIAKAIDERLVDPYIFEDDSTQSWLMSNLPGVSSAALHSGKLKPVYDELTLDGSPEGLDYVQLRIGLLHAGFSWSSRKPE